MALGVRFLHNAQGGKAYKQSLIVNMLKDYYEALYNIPCGETKGMISHCREKIREYLAKVGYPRLDREINKNFRFSNISGRNCYCT